jgi:hypothetical protein
MNRFMKEEAIAETAKLILIVGPRWEERDHHARPIAHDGGSLIGVRDSPPRVWDAVAASDWRPPKPRFFDILRRRS